MFSSNFMWGVTPSTLLHSFLPLLEASIPCSSITHHPACLTNFPKLTFSLLICQECPVPRILDPTFQGISQSEEESGNISIIFFFYTCIISKSCIIPPASTHMQKRLALTLSSWKSVFSSLCILTTWTEHVNPVIFYPWLTIM